jgi:hypothetical protein
MGGEFIRSWTLYIIRLKMGGIPWVMERVHHPVDNGRVFPAANDHMHNIFVI